MREIIESNTVVFDKTAGCGRLVEFRLVRDEKHEWVYKAQLTLAGRKWSTKIDTCEGHELAVAENFVADNGDVVGEGPAGSADEQKWELLQELLTEFLRGLSEFN